VLSVTDADQDRVLRALLAMQRHSWEQGVAGHAALDLGLDDLVTVMARDAVVRQTPYGSLGEMGEDGVLNGAANGEAVRWLAAKDPSMHEALGRQVQWLVRDAPRAKDGTLFHLQRTHEVWADTVYMVVPLLLLVGEEAAALAQLEGHRRRLFDETVGLYAARWDEDTASLTLPQHWGTGNGWVVAGIARAIRQTGPLPQWAAHARVVIDACLARRRPDGIFHDVVDDPTTFAETNLAQMLAYAIFLGVQDGWLPGPYRAIADDLVADARRQIDDDGLVRPVCGAPFFDQPGTSAEAQAFFLLATAAQRDDDRDVG
jgi:unsaturated rhamnogalacturonyl hydrolase